MNYFFQLGLIIPSRDVTNVQCLPDIKTLNHENIVSRLWVRTERHVVKIPWGIRAALGEE